MRIFISINPEDEAKQRIALTQKETIERIEIIKKNLANSIKWESEDKFHITLFFLGEVKPAETAMLVRNLNLLNESFNKNEIKFSGKRINAFPALRIPRVMILELENPDKKIYELKERISEICNRSGFVSDKKFQPHITLGRIKRDIKINLRELECKIRTDLDFSVKSFYLMESKITGAGSEYKVVNEFKFRK